MIYVNTNYLFIINNLASSLKFTKNYMILSSIFNNIKIQSFKLNHKKSLM